MSESPDYLRGLRDGEIRALEHGQAAINRRLDNHEQRITAQERIAYALLGAVTLLQIGPALIRLIEG